MKINNAHTINEIRSSVAELYGIDEEYVIVEPLTIDEETQDIHYSIKINLSKANESLAW